LGRSGRARFSLPGAFFRTLAGAGVFASCMLLGSTRSGAEDGGSAIQTELVAAGVTCDAEAGGKLIVQLTKEFEWIGTASGPDFRPSGRRDCHGTRVGEVTSVFRPVNVRVPAKARSQNSNDESPLPEVYRVRFVFVTLGKGARFVDGFSTFCLVERTRRSGWQLVACGVNS